MTELPEKSHSLADITTVPVYVGDSLMDLQWKVLTLAQLQLRQLAHLVEPGRRVIVTVKIEVDR